MDKKPDKRAVKTQKALQNALAELLNKKVLRKITVGEVADLADVNRVTFYKHYKDIYDLYEQMEKEVLSELGMLILDYQNKTKPDFCSGLVTYIESNSKVFKMVFSFGFALLLPLFFGPDGVLYSMPLSDILTFIISAIIIFKVNKELNEHTATA